MSNSLFSQRFVSLRRYFAAIFGKVEWTTPPWTAYLHQKSLRNPQRFWLTLFSIFVLGAVAIYSYIWHLHQPKPPSVTAAISIPKISTIEENRIVPDVLTLNFGIAQTNPKSFTQQSIAPLKLIGQDVHDGVTITPEITGTWKWQSDSSLVFTPKTDWPAGQTYRIHFAKTFFANHPRMTSDTYTFTTRPFHAKISEFKFYQDPIHPQHHQAIATITFNYPVDIDNFKSHLTLKLQSLKDGKLDLKAKSYPYTLTYDSFKRTAYLHSEFIALPATSQYLRLTLEPGIESMTQSTHTKKAVSANILIPDVNSYFKVISATGTIVRNVDDKPEQVLALETSLGVKESAIKKSLHVYLLPENYPATSNEEEKKQYPWENPGDVNAKILGLSTPIQIEAIPSDHPFATLHSFRFQAPTSRYIYLKWDKGTRSLGDFELTQDYVAVIKVPEPPQEISFLHKGALLALSSEQKLSVLVRGLSAVKFELARVLPHNVNQLVTQTEGDFNNPYFLNQSFNQQNISKIFSEVQTFASNDLTKVQYTALDFSKYLSPEIDTNSPRGLFLLTAQGWDTEQNIPLDVKSNRLILITDMALIVKDNQDATHEVFVQSIVEGKPLSQVSVTLLGKNGLPLMTAITNEQGQASFPAMNGYVDDREPVVYLAALAGDVSFIPYNAANRQVNYSRYDIGGIYSNAQDSQKLNAYLFTDRGIYRPGDTVHLGMIVKQAFVHPQPKGSLLELTVTDPRGTTIQDQKLTLDELGYLSFDFSTEPSSPTGQYSINLYIVKDNHADNLLGSTTCQVAEFLPDTMKIQAEFPSTSPGWLSPDHLTAQVTLANLYGAPAVDRRVTGRILLEPKTVTFDQYPDYTFVDPFIDPNKAAKVWNDNLVDLKTNAKGEALFDLNLERFGQGTYQLSFFAEGFAADSGRSVSTMSTTLVSSLPYLIGYKPDGDLKFIRKDSQRHIHFIAVDPKLNQQKTQGLTLELISEQPISTLIKKPDGTYQYQSVIQSKIIQKQAFTIPEGGFNYAIPTQSIGDFKVKIINEQNIELTHASFSVVGNAQKSMAKNAELSVKLSREAYKAGDDIELQITAPYTGSGLITIERDKVYAVQWFKTETTNSIQKIRIPPDFQGNGYVNITFARDWNSPDIFTSPLSYSVVPFEVDHKAHEIQIDLDVPKLAEPGQSFTIQYQSDKPGKIIVFAADEGILQVAHYEAPDPLAYFFDKQALQVSTQQTVDQILPQYLKERELSSVGGDASEYAMANYLNPFKRKTDLPVAYWSGIVETDSNPRSLVYDLPDYFNGTLHIFAVAVGLDSVGAYDTTSHIRAHFVITPNVPTFVAPGDVFEITASIANYVKNSGKHSNVAVELEVSPELEIIGSALQTLPIAEEQEQTVHYKLRAKSALGSATVSFTAKIGSESSTMDTSLSVRPATPLMTTITSGVTQKPEVTLDISRKLYPEERLVTAAMSPSPLLLVSGLQRYLESYPYGCTEQLVSQAFPLLAIASQVEFAKDATKVLTHMNKTIQMLGQRQMSNGGFSYWPGVSEFSENSFASVYAMHFLTEAKAQNYPVPNESFQAGIRFLKEFSAQNASDLDMARIQAYAIYVLTRNEWVTTNELGNLQLYLEQNAAKTWQQDLTGAYIAATYQLLKNDTEAERIIHQYVPPQNEKLSHFYDTHLANAQYLYLVAKHFPKELRELGTPLVFPLVTATNSSNINTLFAAYASLAFSAYAPLEVGSMQGMQCSIRDIPATSNLSRKEQAGYCEADIGPASQQLVFENPLKQTYFYQFVQTGFDSTLPTEVIEQGLEVAREYRTSQNVAVSETPVGAEIEVHIQARAVGDDLLNQVAIVDLLPGGFEVVRDSVHPENISFFDIREDRVIFFLYLDNSAQEIVYKIKATNAGKYTVPPIFAESMYDPEIKARGLPQVFTVTKP